MKIRFKREFRSHRKDSVFDATDNAAESLIEKGIATAVADDDDEGGGEKGSPDVSNKAITESADNKRKRRK